MIPTSVINFLISVGRSRRPRIPTSLADRSNAERAILSGFEPWEIVAMASDEETITDIIKGLVLFGRETGITGDSVTPVKVLHKVFADRFPLAEPSLTAWIGDNRVNEYDPFGCLDHGNARSMDEFRAYTLQKKVASEAASAREAERQANARDAKSLRVRDSATAHLANAVRRGDLAAVTELLAKGADPVQALPGGSLVDLAVANGRENIVTLLRARGLQ